MKKIFIMISMIAAIFVSCDPKDSKEYKALQAQRDSLESLTGEKEGVIMDYITSMNQIQENLEVIKEKEKIITVNSQSANGEQEQSVKDKINQDIQLIYDLMKKNKQTIWALQKKLKNANIKINELQQMLVRMQKQMEEKDIEINQLKEQLAKLDIEVQHLTSKIDTLTTENKQQQELIAQKNEAINTAYYVFGTKKELIEKKVITKEGGFIGIGGVKKLLQDFNQNYFTKIDITQTTTINLAAKKATLVTTHPSSSYKLEGNDKVEKLIITDYEKFWSASKYLVIVIE